MIAWIRRGLTLVVVLPGLLFLVLVLRWLVDPASAAPALRITLETGFRA
ncbi:MAG: hypothetical protein ABGY96_07460 [bacterium]